MRKNIIYLLLAVFSISLLIVPVSSLSEEDSCKETGIVVKNLTLKNLWYKKGDDACFLWRQNYMFTIHPGETIGVYSDLTCKKLYCGVEHTFYDYKAIDSDNNCRVRILSGCNLSDM
jgi:hypothetical protein